MAFHQYAEKLGHKAKLESAEKATQATYQILKNKKVRGEKPQDKESPTANTERLKKVEVAKAELEKANGSFTTHDTKECCRFLEETVVPRTSLPSLSGPERNPGRKWVSETPIR